jgi:putative ATP-dependent endonuclease of OLD family
MHITEIRIRNFQNFFLCLTQALIPVIGENGSGKTNVFQAVRLLIDD